MSDERRAPEKLEGSVRTQPNSATPKTTTGPLSGFGVGEIPLGIVRFGLHTSNVELIRAKDGAAPAPQEECLTQASDPSIG